MAHVAKTIRTYQQDASVVAFCEQVLRPLPERLSPYAQKWREFDALVDRLPAAHPFRAKLEEAKALANRAAARSAELFALARSTEKRAFDRINNPRRGEKEADSRKGRRDR